MNEDLILRVENIFDRYDKDYTRDGFMVNLRKWETNKARLIDLLRKHPNWNEDAMAVTFGVTENRDIDNGTVWECANAVAALRYNVEITVEEREDFYKVFRLVTETCTKSIDSEATARDIKEMYKVPCAVGQKRSRVINAICKKYGVDKHPEYNARFAQLADSLNPIQVKRTALLSVHPCDYLEMSNIDNSWRSCHNLEGGEYMAGTLSYMNDEVSMIFYTVDNGVSVDYYKAEKRTRQVFCYGDGILLQSRLYPNTNDEETRDAYRNIVQHTIADCEGVPNLWTLKKTSEDVNARCCTDEDARHYHDYDYKEFKANVSMLKELFSGTERIVIGHEAYCIYCGKHIYNNGELYCDDCDDNSDYTYCHECDERVEREGAYYIGDHWYCCECSTECEDCGERVVNRDVYTVYGGGGYERSVCETCRDRNYRRCEHCDDDFAEDYGSEIEGEFYCRDCVDKVSTNCEGCDEPILNENVVRVGDCSYCEDCSEDICDDDEAYAVAVGANEEGEWDI